MPHNSYGVCGASREALVTGPPSVQLLPPVEEDPGPWHGGSQRLPSVTAGCQPSRKKATSHGRRPPAMGEGHQPWEKATSHGRRPPVREEGHQSGKNDRGGSRQRRGARAPAEDETLVTRVSSREPLGAPQPQPQPPPPPPPQPQPQPLQRNLDRPSPHSTSSITSSPWGGVAGEA